jgi:hypothetical protein
LTDTELLHPTCLRPSVLRLLFSRSPAHVARLVTATVIDSLNRQVRRWLPTNMGIKSFKAVAPLIAHRNSATAVIAKHRMPTIETPLFNIHPSPIFRGVMQPMLDAVFVSKAAAAFGLCAVQVGAMDSDHLTAATSAQPAGMTAMISDSFNSGKTAEGLSSKVNKFRHEAL